MVNVTYGVAGAYVLTDTAHRANTVPAEQSAVVEAIDTLLWQTAASVVIPGFFINRAVWMAGRLTAVKWIPTAAGIVSIPIIVEPIDHAVDYAMDHVVRPLFPNSAGGAGAGVGAGAGSDSAAGSQPRGNVTDIQSTTSKKTE
jgi:fission process protein 1